MKKLFRYFGLIAVLLVSVLSPLLGGCGAPKGEGFAIYLTRDDVPPQKMEALSYVPLEEQPVLSLADIISYNAQTHEIKLNPPGFGRIAHLQVPVQGKSFMVCVDKSPVYWGAFWTPISSLSFSGVTIWQPLPTEALPVVTLSLGYPNESFYGGTDPRSNPDILKSLRKAGKLIDKLSIATIAKIPHSLKGYELYSWLEGSQWRFTLITGTNRNKTPEEITSQGDFISETGWIKISVAGIEPLKIVLSKLAEGESVIWLANLWATGPGTGIKIELPPAQIKQDIKEYADKRLLDFQIASP